jgi:hypothetical protein
MVRN